MTPRVLLVKLVRLSHSCPNNVCAEVYTEDPRTCLPLSFYYIYGTIFFFFLRFIYLFIRQRETASERGNTSRGSGRGRNRLLVEEPDVGPHTGMPGSRPELKADA